MAFYRRVRNAETARFEAGRAWREVSATFRRRNPLCQAIVDGVRCLNEAKIVHHLIAPEERPDLRIDWKNLVACCLAHHGPEAGDVGRYEYAPTKLIDGTEHPHLRRYGNQLQATGTPGAKLFTSGAAAITNADEILEEARRLLGN